MKAEADALAPERETTPDAPSIVNVPISATAIRVRLIIFDTVALLQ